MPSGLQFKYFWGQIASLLKWELAYPASTVIIVFFPTVLDDGQPDGFVNSSVDPSDGVADEPDLLDLQQLEQVDPSGDHPVLLARLLQRQDLPVKPIF